MNRRSLKVINEAIVHCSASPYASHDDVSVINEWHKERSEKEKGWMVAPEGDYPYCGYHYFIKTDGTIQKGRKLEWYGQHCSGKNWSTVGICLSGMGGKKGKITEEQLSSLRDLLVDLKKELPKLNKVSQHSQYCKTKPFCAGLTVSELRMLNNAIDISICE